jgi:sulfite reductase beta subunit-like hemoprotein
MQKNAAVKLGITVFSASLDGEHLVAVSDNQSYLMINSAMFAIAMQNSIVIASLGSRNPEKICSHKAQTNQAVRASSLPLAIRDWKRFRRHSGQC